MRCRCGLVTRITMAQPAVTCLPPGRHYGSTSSCFMIGC